MKTITTIFIAVFFLSINGYSQNTDVKALLDKQETRTQIFNTILGNHQLMMEFMKEMKGNEHAMMMMKENKQMMNNDDKMGMNHEHQTKENGKMMNHDKMMNQGKMMDHDKMMIMMKENPEMMKKMMSNMMEMCEKDGVMRSKMVDMMVQHPELMKTTIQKLNSKSTLEIVDSTMNHLHQH